MTSEVKSGFADASMGGRIRLTLPGQLTWVDLSNDSKCVDCTFNNDPKITNGEKKGWRTCRKVGLHTKKQGVPFDPKIALACSQFEEKSE